MSEVRNVAIVGSGPAGYTAALYASRANLQPLMFSGDEIGGQLMTTSEVENYPGFPEGLMGPEMMEKFRAQAGRFGTEFIDSAVEKVELDARPFKLHVGKDVYRAHSVIISTGASARWLDLPGELDLRTGGKGLTACATCDGFFYRDQEVVVIGGGDTAMEEAHFLTKFCKKVTIIHRREGFRASKIMLQRAQDHEKIEFKVPYVVTGYSTGGPNGGIDGVELENTDNGEKEQLACTGVFMAIGHIPNTDFLDGQLRTDDSGYLLVGPAAEAPVAMSTATSVEGVFACGDCQDHVYRQAVTAAGTGCAAAIDAERWLASQGVEG